VTVTDPAVLGWLLEGDPSIRWKVLRDLEGAAPDAVARERAKVATQGWGARLLAAQGPDGRWGGGDYTPKWTSTTYTLLALHWMGLPSGHPAAIAGCTRLWEWQAKQRRPETCIMSMLVLISSSHGYDDQAVAAAVDWLRQQQLDDGGWNCRTLTDRSKHGSFHTSISALDALNAYSHRHPEDHTTVEQQRGRDFFLRHRLYKSHRTGEVAIPASVRFPLLPQWHFDVLRGLEHFAAVAAPADPRLEDAVGVIRRAQRGDGRWPTYAPHQGKAWFTMEARGPSRWNTARALRVLHWWEGAPAA
jgi:hypothetical protein